MTLAEATEVRKDGSRRFRDADEQPHPLRGKLLVGTADAVTVAFSMALAFPLTMLGGVLTTSVLGRHTLVGALALPLWIAAFSRQGLYYHRRISSQIEETRRIFRGVLFGSVITALIGFVLNAGVSRGVVCSAGVATVSLLLERKYLRRHFVRKRRGGQHLRSVVVVGANEEGRELVAMLERDTSLGYRVVDVVDVGEHAPGSDDVPVLRSTRELLDTVRTLGATGVLVATTAVSTGVLNGLTRDLIDEGVHVELSSSLRDIAVRRLSVRSLGRCAVTYVEPVRNHGWRAAAKRGFDLVLSGTAVVAAFPMLLLAAVAIKLETRGPVLFRQQRVGRDGVPFNVLKLRTMVVDAEELLIDLRDSNEADGPLFKMKADPRITKVGRVLRRLSLDELPQFINVLRNEMSVVGPRPALPTEVAAWAPELFPRLRVKPGITGAWQVNGRSNSSFEEYVRLDLYYVENWSLLTDLAIVAKTLPSVAFSRGAY